MQFNPRLPAIALLSCALLGCAGTQSRNTDPVNDPWEGYNRKVYALNMGLDKVIRPVAVGYDKVMPDPFQRGILDGVDGAELEHVRIEGGQQDLGADGRVGLGDLALFDGNPFEYTTHCTGTVIEGVVVSEGEWYEDLD